MVHLDYRDARPIYTQIIDGVKEQITTGVLMPGDKLPSVREMASALAINPNTIQRAYRLLEFNGWIVTIPERAASSATTKSRWSRKCSGGIRPLMRPPQASSLWVFPGSRWWSG